MFVSISEVHGGDCSTAARVARHQTAPGCLPAPGEVHQHGGPAGAAGERHPPEGRPHQNPRAGDAEEGG